MRYYIIDSGERMVEFADMIGARLKKDGHHYIQYLTNLPEYLGVEEVTEDDFLDHYKKVQQELK